MKKMLVLALVLAVAGLANAGLVLSFDEATQTVSVSSDAAILGGAGVNNGLGLNGAALGTIVLAARPELTAADATIEQIDGTTALEAGLAYDGGYGNVAWGKPLVDSPAGLWFSAPIISQMPLKLGNGPVRVALTGFDAEGALVELGSINLMVPEPMTMGLLALGGLFLRKRK